MSRITHFLREIGAELARLDVGRKSLRSFGLLVGTILLAIGTWMFWRYGPSVALSVVGAVGGVLVALGGLYPVALKQAYRIWMGLAIMIGLIVTPVILTIVFLVVVTPIGLVLRLLRKDPLTKGPDPQARTYWIPKERNLEGRERLERYY